MLVSVILKSRKEKRGKNNDTQEDYKKVLERPRY